jgi:glycosyltransferase involved in cell wall biosynthesis
MTSAIDRRSVAIVTPWYPSSQATFAGAFVSAMVEAVVPGCDEVTVYHCDRWGSRATEAEDLQTWSAHRELLSGGVPRGQTTAGAGLVYVPVPVRSEMSFAANAIRYAEALKIALGGRPIDAAVVHAHVGLRGGWVALENARPDARVFVTEHATFLEQVLAQPDSRAMYDQVLTRCDRFFVVGEPARQPLVEAFPHHADKISLVPNPVRFDRTRTTPVTELRRWLFIGHFIERKGVGLLLEAFAKCHAEDPTLHLSFIGEGTLAPSLRQRAHELDITDAVTFHGPLTPDQTLHTMAEHDLLVHPSRHETFGMTIIEAIAVGIPVLVTRCGGPEQTLAGIETDASEFINVTDNPDDIVTGYHHLRQRLPQLNIAHAQDTLATKYSYPAVAAAHHNIWFPTDSEKTG